MILFEKVNKKDSKLLVSWWNANTKWYYFRIKLPKSKFYKIIRQ